MDNKKRCCETCSFYGVNANGERICEDDSGLYFHWIMEPEDKCPDYVEAEVEVEDLVS